MTVASSTDRATFPGNGVTQIFPLPFRFFANSEIQAWLVTNATGALTALTLGTHYTLSGAGDPEVDGNPTSELTMLTAPTSLQSLFVLRVIPVTQPTDIVNQGRFFPEIHENVFDRLTMLIQQANGESKGAIRVAIGDPEPARLPNAVSRALLLLGFDSAGNPIAVAPVSGSAADLAMNLANATDPAKGAGLVGYSGTTVHEKLMQDLPSVLDFGADPTGVIDATAQIQAFINAYKDLVQSGPASYSGGITAKLSKGTYLISSRLKLWSLITLEGDGPFTTVFKAAPGFTDFEYMMSASPSLDGDGTIRPAVGLRNLGFDHNNTGARGFIGHALNDNCIFDNIRSFNFRKSVVILDRGAGGGTVAQGWTLSNWHAITQYDVEEDIFITHEANEGLILACKALGLSTGVSTAVGFHIGKSGHSEGINIIGSSAAHLVNGFGVRFNDTRDCWATGNTFENLLRDVYIGHASLAASCTKNSARNNRHYPTVGAPGTQRDIYIALATSCIGETRENGAIEITVDAVNCQGVLATNRTTGSTLPPTVTLASNSSVVLETHKNGSAIHHVNGSLSMDASASNQFDITLPGGGMVRGDANFISLLAAAGKGSRLISAGATATVSDNGIVINSSATKTVALQENGVNKILLDGSGRVRVFGLTTAVPGVADALYKDVSGFVKIT